MTSIPLESLAMTAVGISGTIAGTLDLVKGRNLKGAEVAFLGMTLTNLGGRFLGPLPKIHSKLMQWTLGAAAGAFGAVRRGSWKSGIASVPRKSV